MSLRFASARSSRSFRVLRRAIVTATALTLLAPALVRAQGLVASPAGSRLAVPGSVAMGAVLGDTVAREAGARDSAASVTVDSAITLVRAAAPGGMATTRETAASLAASSEAFATAVRGVPELERSGQVLVVNLAARRVWLLEGGEVRFTAPVAVGKGTGQTAAQNVGEFATPRGRFVVTRRDSVPLWVPPDWHFAEVSRKTGRPLRRLGRGDVIRTRDGSTIYVEGNEVMRRRADGTTARMGKGLDEPGARELVVDGQLIVPPIGTTQRQYPRVLGARRLNLRDGYAFHGTDKPETVGKAVSHGCLRMRDADVTALYEAVQVGTPVYLK